MTVEELQVQIDDLKREMAELRARLAPPETPEQLKARIAEYIEDIKKRGELS